MGTDRRRQARPSHRPPNQAGGDSAVHSGVPHDRFVRWPPSGLERREKLEQLRAIENGMRVDAAAIARAPLGVDTPDDLARVRALTEAAVR